MKLKLLFIIYAALHAGHVLCAAVYVKKIDATVYYETGASSCNEVTVDNTPGDLEAAVVAAGGGALVLCEGAEFIGKDLDSDSSINLGSGNTGLSISVSGDVIIDANSVGDYVFNVDGANGAKINVTTGNSLTLKNPTKDCIYAIGNLSSGFNINGVICLDSGKDGISIVGWNYNLDSIYITNNTVIGHAGTGIEVRGGYASQVTGVVVSGNTVKNGGTMIGGHGISFSVGSGNTPSGGTNWTQDGVKPWYYKSEKAKIYRVIINAVENLAEHAGTCPNNLLEGEWCYNGFNNKLYVYKTGGGDPDKVKVIYTYGKITAVAHDNIVINQQRPGREEGHGIAADDFSQVTAYKNRIDGSSGSGMTANYADTPLFFNNIITNSGDDDISILQHTMNAGIYNNALSGASNDSIGVNPGAVTATLKNNLCYGYGRYGLTGPGSGVTASNNLTYSAGGEGNTIGVNNVHGLTIDPQLDSYFRPHVWAILSGGVAVSGVTQTTDYYDTILREIPIGAVGRLPNVNTK
jgi:hypothetical protein